MSGGSPSLTKSLRTTKVAVGGVPEVGFTDVMFTVQASCDIPSYLLDDYNRPSPWYSSLNYEGYPMGNHGGGSNGAAGCKTPLYRIEIENLLRPQYAEYLNVPQGIMMTQSEYQNRPRADLMGMNRDRAFGYDGSYVTGQYPLADLKKVGDEKAFLNTLGWEQSTYDRQFDSRQWARSADTSSGF